MELVKKDNIILKTVCKSFDFDNPIMDPYSLVEEMHRIRRKGGGVGLAANQVGINTRVLVIGMGDFTVEGADDFAKAFFNPEITEYSKETVMMMEGCLTYHNLFVRIKRPKSIKITWQTEEGTMCEGEYSGITARILQHEVDHLDGITFDTIANPYHLAHAKKHLEKVKRIKRREKYLYE